MPFPKWNFPIIRSAGIPKTFSYYVPIIVPNFEMFIIKNAISGRDFSEKFRHILQKTLRAIESRSDQNLIDQGSWMVKRKRSGLNILRNDVTPLPDSFCPSSILPHVHHDTKIEVVERRNIVERLTWIPQPLRDICVGPKIQL
ncbi:hypothetical protein [Corynebacterium lujinxingii]|uniref:Uncharacterized protein n=1 Tax=Corynebacterium lujinxingii TaxID=2763010 RepID=A0A7H0K115_9CORY|nr:hypothetical protein [Corynebacterium lujinxingii]MBC3178430.1 hypothetical protein [Corynebacterium lujinxingii]NNO10635.1 hypothetical protein [Corynebacterium lujinxingii]QNP90981.1 hypothetical protein IAU68_04245 [Corynebacterium lujinxingii]